MMIRESLFYLMKKKKIEILFSTVLRVCSPSSVNRFDFIRILLYLLQVQKRCGNGSVCVCTFISTAEIIRCILYFVQSLLHLKQ